MGAAAVRIAREIGYVGAGTCEFLVEDDAFYFLEMNTRLQVEHPVTELVTGIDLVHAQLRIADGRPLGFEQAEVSMRGHAIEARINAEHVAAGFAPAPGLITAWSPPGGPGVRVDGGAVAGWEIPRDYDSLVAKMIAYGEDRDEARRKLLRACGEFVVEGVPTTLDFHRFALAHHDFVAGNVATTTVEGEWDLSAISPAEGAQPGAGPVSPSSTYLVEVDGRRFEVALYEPEHANQVNRRRRAGSAAGQSAGPGQLTAPMQGTVVKTPVGVGDAVERGDLVVALEAMKMENHLTADRDGVITTLEVAPGDVVHSGDLLAVIGDA